MIKESSILFRRVSRKVQFCIISDLKRHDIFVITLQS